MGEFLDGCLNCIQEQLLVYDKSARENGMFDKAAVVMEHATFADYYNHALWNSDPSKVTEWVNKRYLEITSKEKEL